MKLRPKLFFKEAFLFAATMAIGIFTAYRYSLMPDSVQLPEVSLSFWDGLVLIAVILFFVFAPKYKRVAKYSFKFFLVFVVFAGTQIIAGAVLAPPMDLFAALIAVLIFVFLRSVLIHNIGVILGIAGVASVLGLAVSPKTALFLLVVLSFYDILSVYVTKHMIAMARNMIESGAPFGFIVPNEGASFLEPRHEAQARIGEQYMILGSGDVGLPLILACSLVGFYVSEAVIVGLFSVAGLLLTHLIFVNQTVRRPMAALPPIATMAIIGYLVSQLIK
jgi:presenilin-like A22 family membrane protease